MNAMAALAPPAFKAGRWRSAPPAGVFPDDLRLLLITTRLVLALALLAWLALAGQALLRQPAFALRGIRIEGEVGRNSASTIRANALPKLNGNFFTVDLTAARRAFESVPWVRQAVVRRVWPNRLAVTLEEHRPVAVWNDEAAGDRLVNSFGEVFEANLGDVEDDSLPTLSGPPGSAAHVLAVLQRLAPLLAPLGVHADSLRLSGRGSWHAELDSGAELELGRGSDDELLARASRFAATLGQVTQRFQRPLEYADLRHTDGYAVRLKGVTTTTTAVPLSAAAAPATTAARRP